MQYMVRIIQFKKCTSIQSTIPKLAIMTYPLYKYRVTHRNVDLFLQTMKNSRMTILVILISKLRHPVLGVISSDLVLKSTMLISNKSFEDCRSFHSIGMNREANYTSRNLSLCALNQGLYWCQLSEDDSTTNSVEAKYSVSKLVMSKLDLKYCMNLLLFLIKEN